jgi:hypothetical protein
VRRRSNAVTEEWRSHKQDIPPWYYCFPVICMILPANWASSFNASLNWCSSSPSFILSIVSLIQRVFLVFRPSLHFRNQTWSDLRLISCCCSIAFLLHFSLNLEQMRLKIKSVEKDCFSGRFWSVFQLRKCAQQFRSGMRSEGEMLSSTWRTTFIESYFEEKGCIEEELDWEEFPLAFVVEEQGK